MVGLVESFISFSINSDRYSVILSMFFPSVFSVKILHLFLKRTWGSFWRSIIFRYPETVSKSIFQYSQYFCKFSPLLTRGYTQHFRNLQGICFSSLAFSFLLKQQIQYVEKKGNLFVCTVSSVTYFCKQTDIDRENTSKTFLSNWMNCSINQRWCFFYDIKQS